MNVPLDQAIATYTAHFRETHPKTKTWQAVNRSLHAFRRKFSLSYVHLVSPAVVNCYIEVSHRNQVSVLRGFLEWCNKTYALSLYVPPHHKNSYQNAADLKAPRFTQARLARARWEADAAQAADRCVQSHQRLIFFLGYCWGIKLPTQLNLTREELGMRCQRDDAYGWLTDVLTHSPTGNKPLRKWLGDTQNYASIVWRTWTGVKFQSVINAGRYERLRLGAYPGGGRSFLRRAVESLETGDAVVERMKRWWT